jgi:hypothetical protein
MNYEEKLIRYIASKLIQRKYFMKKGEFPNQKKLEQYINMVCASLKEKYRDLKYVRNKTEDGMITPIISECVSKIKIL